MRITLENRLLVINLLVILLIIIITFVPYDLPRIILGLPFVMFFPGYTLIAALFPKRDAIDSIERVALSPGLSIAVVVLILLISSYSPWGIKLYPILFSLTIFIFVTSAVAWYRQWRLAEVEKPIISLNLNFSFRRRQGFLRILSVILIVAILGGIGVSSYFIMTPKVGDTFTEFYILGLGGEAEDYPQELKIGEEGLVIVSIINREQQPVTYSLEVLVDGVENSKTGFKTLEHEGQWEGIVTFIPSRAGDNQKVEFLLYRLDQDEVYRRLHLWIDVKEQPLE